MNDTLLQSYEFLKRAPVCANQRAYWKLPETMKKLIARLLHRQHGCNNRVPQQQTPACPPFKNGTMISKRHFDLKVSRKRRDSAARMAR